MRRLLAVPAVALLLVAAALATGCRTRLGDLTIASTKNVGLNPEPVKRSVEGKDCANFLLFIPIGKLNPNLEDAMEAAMEKVAAGNIMTDVAIYVDQISAIVFNQVCYRVKGDVGIQR